MFTCSVRGASARPFLARSLNQPSVDGINHACPSTGYPSGAYTGSNSTFSIDRWALHTFRSFLLCSSRLAGKSLKLRVRLEYISPDHTASSDGGASARVDGGGAICISVAPYSATPTGTARLRSLRRRHCGHVWCARSSHPARAYNRAMRPCRSARLDSPLNTCRRHPPRAPLVNRVWRVRILLYTVHRRLRRLQVHFQRITTRTALTMSNFQPAPAAKSR